MALEDSFAVSVEGTDNPVEEVEVGGSSVSLKVRDRIRFGQKIKVSYTPPATSKITDVIGNALAALTDKEVANEVRDPNDIDPPVFEEAETDKEGREITLSFDEDVVAIIPPNPVTNLNELDVGADTGNANRFYITWRWSPGEEDNSNERQNYKYRTREHTNPVSAWSDYTTTEQGEVTIDNLPPNKSYQIGVVAENIGGESDETTDIADTPVVEAGNPPINFAITGKGRKLDSGTYKYFMAFEYDRDPDDTEPITRYEYRYKESTSNTWPAWTDNALNLTFEIIGLKRNTQYDIEVRTQNFIGASDEASLQDTVTFNTPNTPTMFTATPSRGGDKTNGWTYKIDIGWGRPTEDDTNPIDGWRYRYKLSTETKYGSWVAVANAATGASITGLTHTVKYDIELEATNNEGGSAAATVDDVVIFTTPDPVTSLIENTSNEGTIDTPNLTITFEWLIPTADSRNTIDDVLVRTRNTDNEWGSTAFISKGAAAKSHAINMLSEGTYEIEVKTTNSAGDSTVVTKQATITVLIAGPSLEVTAQGTSPRGSFNLVAVPGIADALSNDDIPEGLGYFELEYHPPGSTDWITWSGSNKSSDSPDGSFWMSAANFDVFSPVLSNGNFAKAQGLTTFVGYVAQCRMIHTDGTPLSRWTEATAP